MSDILNDYPTRDFIEELEDYAFRDDCWVQDAADLLLTRFAAAWKSTFYGAFDEHRAKDWSGHEVIRAEFHTRGWSGCEEMISTILKHWQVSFMLVEWHRGGHWYFEIPAKYAGERRGDDDTGGQRT